MRASLSTMFPKGTKAARAPAAKRATELAAWGMTPSLELLELAKLHDAGKTSSLGEYRPFYFKERFFTPKNRFDDYLLQAQEFGWPVFYLAHFAGLYPIGASGGGDFWLARVAGERDGTSRVYEYDHETGELRLSFASIAALIVAARDKVDFHPLPAVALPRLDASDDPIALWKRASWMAELVGANALESWREILEDAATLKTFAKEKALLAKRPDLAAYWLKAHGLLGNADEFATTEAAAAKSTNPFVMALRPRAKALLGPATIPELALRKQSGDHVAHLLAELRKVAPKALRRGAPPPLPQAAPVITEEEVTALAKKGKLLAFMTEHPARESLHVWALHNIALWAKVDRGPVEVLERIADFTITKKRMSVSDSGQREAQLLALLVARRSRRAAEIVVRTLTLLEKCWTRIVLAVKTAKLAAKLDPERAGPILRRMIAHKTWQIYETEAMPQLRAALKSI